MLDSTYAILHAAHLRVTGPRMAVVGQLLRMRDRVIAVDAIHRNLLMADEAVSLTTCRRVLDELVKFHILTRDISTGRRWTYCFTV